MPNELLVTIRGIAFLHSDRVNDSLSLFDEALASDPDNLAALCAATWANYFVGRPGKMSLLLERIGAALDRNK